MAIHIEHGEHLTIVIFTKPDASSTYEYGYVIGELSPHYPVPAKILNVDCLHTELVQGLLHSLAKRITCASINNQHQ